jgi:hypothetical protein
MVFLRKADPRPAENTWKTLLTMPAKDFARSTHRFPQGKNVDIVEYHARSGRHIVLNTHRIIDRDIVSIFSSCR